MNWKVYVLQCADESLYTGITTDLNRRLNEHNTDNKKGARYTRARRPLNLIYYESYANRSEASSREYQLKKMSRAEKLKLASASHSLNAHTSPTQSRPKRRDK